MPDKSTLSANAYLAKLAASSENFSAIFALVNSFKSSTLVTKSVIVNFQRKKAKFSALPF
jgi:hypothetical protein